MTDDEKRKWIDETARAAMAAVYNAASESTPCTHIAVESYDLALAMWELREKVNK